MEISKVTKASFSVIGKEGSTLDGDGFIKGLWDEANSHFDEVADIAKRTESGCLVGIWGAMTDHTRSFLPWENNFSSGLYLAGVECNDSAEAPTGWAKWTVPGYEYITVKCKDKNTFKNGIEYINKNGFVLVGAVHDFTDPATAENYMFFPIKKL